MLKALTVIIPLVMAIYAIIECVQSDDEDRAGMHKGIWIVLIVIFPLLGSIAWFVVSRTVRARSGSGGGDAGHGARRPIGPAAPSGPMAPDDDPDFLWRIEQERRRARRELEHRDQDENPTGDKPAGDDAP